MLFFAAAAVAAVMVDVLVRDGRVLRRCGKLEYALTFIVYVCESGYHSTDGKGVEM